MGPLAGALLAVVAIQDVTVIDPFYRAVLEGHTVVIRDGVIADVSRGKAPPGARVIDGKGKFLIPGLWDSHVHLTKAGAGVLPVFLAHGVTSVRDLGSDHEEVLGWRREIEAGKRVGPRIKTSGRILEDRSRIERMLREGGVEPVARIRMPVGDEAEAREAVRTLKRAGVDLIKMRTAPNEGTFLAAVDEARKLGLPFAAHPMAKPEVLFRSGLGTVEHGLMFPPNAEPDFQKRMALYQKMARSGLRLSTTLVNLDGSLLISYEDAKRRMLRRPKYISDYLFRDWAEQVEEKKEMPADLVAKLAPDLVREVREMGMARVPMMAGTDLAVAFIEPGVSLHEELRTLVQDAELSEMDALRAATSEPAAYFGMQKSLGGILAPGQIADLVLLDANPMKDITNTRRIAGVMQRGQWHDRRALDRLLQ